MGTELKLLLAESSLGRLCENELITPNQKEERRMRRQAPPKLADVRELFCPCTNRLLFHFFSFKKMRSPRALWITTECLQAKFHRIGPEALNVWL
uniref:Uncharacterized protein n=1 Tax=Podarcis muralis TaxID=64176 RepID=A0A670HY41_PODMU